MQLSAARVAEQAQSICGSTKDVLKTQARKLRNRSVLLYQQLCRIHSI